MNRLGLILVATVLMIVGYLAVNQGTVSAYTACGCAKCKNPNPVEVRFSLFNTPEFVKEVSGDMVLKNNKDYCQVTTCSICKRLVLSLLG
jgi:hypothetical protein